MAEELTRRDAILTAVAAALAAGPPVSGAAQDDPALAAFLALSEALTGASGLDPAVGRTLLDAFAAAGEGPALRAMALGAGDEDQALGDAVVAAWYSGLYEDGGVQKVADFEGALVWSALAFTKPFAQCGGPTGYWSEPPDA